VRRKYWRIQHFRRGFVRSTDRPHSASRSWKALETKVFQWNEWIQGQAWSVRGPCSIARDLQIILQWYRPTVKESKIHIVNLDGVLYNDEKRERCCPNTTSPSSHWIRHCSHMYITSWPRCRSASNMNYSRGYWNRTLLNFLNDSIKRLVKLAGSAHSRFWTSFSEVSKFQQLTSLLISFYLRLFTR